MDPELVNARENFIQGSSRLDNLVGLNLNVADLSTDAAVGLVNHDFGMRQCKTTSG